VSELEETFALQLKALHLPDAQRELCFMTGRKWRFDFAWPAERLAVEIEGGVWSRGRHTRGVGFTEDCDKYNCAALAGWTVLRYTEQHVQDWTAAHQVAEALKALELPFTDPPEAE